ncbi:cytochrome d ubiquinol oxidase subunit II [Acidiferrimicrobium sp. IK]|uniref:cytochrome d ubiquinol oxidase subunit II n=1 Tax=Acidiferrimicrobium sp. IK TaxID=2871700 RepID=UPI0021CB4FF6|nr:cytochrome d ubiquinol oxidase subunit II [Acidiferrimicrobium sp. IK]MCU4182869.1 cytochrome d ubiquinol oxidase subunit II [Acidiferrimicrobium sp. IK]
MTAVLPGFWFGVLAVLWAGFFLLDGFDFGVGMLLPIVGRTDGERRVALRAIGPVWDGNEVWLLTAGGATFAAFPEWYASMFSGLYIPFAVVLAGLIVRGIGIEYRGKVHTAAGRAWCDRGVIVGSVLPALLFGVAFADLIRGLHMTAGHVVNGSFWDLVTPFGLLGGVVTLLFFAYHGAVFLALRTEGPVRDRGHKLATRLAAPLVAVAVVFLAWSSSTRSTAVSVAVALVLAVAVLASVVANQRRMEGWAFAASAVAALGLPVFVFASLWPDVIPARNNSAWSLTVHNASSSHYTLVVMTVVALIFTPVVLAYQAWTYWVFRARVTDATVALPSKLRPTVSAAAAYRPTGAGSPQGAAGRQGSHQPEDVGQPEDAGSPEGAGSPEDAGSPEGASGQPAPDPDTASQGD